MDDLRTESPRVQAKHMAAAKALIASTDIDGMRIDTPMQVDLSFFKAWAPAVKRYAADALNKTNFGMWGEFFVSSGRFATMTGRGKEVAMYGNDSAFIDEVTTLNGGIDYDPYHYFRWMLLRDEIGQFPIPDAYRERFDGLAALWQRDVEQLDTFNPQTGRDEHTMWHFCNNHDQWRFSTIDDDKGLDLFRICLGWMTFWPGVPLHYAGDEQAFKTYGTALDGWAREPLSLSLAYRAMGTLPDRDHFDMTSATFLHVQRLNRIHRQYLRPCLLPSGDAPLNMHQPRLQHAAVYAQHGAQAFAWERGCPNDENANSRLLVVISLDRRAQASQPLIVNTSWAAGSRAVDVLLAANHTEMYDVLPGGQIALTLPPFGVAVLVHVSAWRPLPPVVQATAPAYDELITAEAAHAARGLSVRFAFDGPVNASDLVELLYDGYSILDSSSVPPAESGAASGPASESVSSAGSGGTWCTRAAGCDEIVRQLPGPLAPGPHTLTLRFAGSGSATRRIGSVFQSRFRVAPMAASASTSATAVPAAHDAIGDVISDPRQARQDGLVSEGRQQLRHVARGATHYRVRRANQPVWQFSEWQSIRNHSSPVAFESVAGVSTVVQCALAALACSNSPQAIRGAGVYLPVQMAAWVAHTAAFAACATCRRSLAALRRSARTPAQITLTAARATWPPAAAKPMGACALPSPFTRR